MILIISCYFANGNNLITIKKSRAAAIEKICNCYNWI